MSRLTELESNLTPQQIRGAQLLIQNDFEGKPKKQEELAEEIGVSRMELYRWRYEDPHFIEYSRLITLQQLDGQMSFVGSKLMESINKGHTKAIELYLKWRGELINQTEVHRYNYEQPAKLSVEEMQQKLEEMHAKLH